MSYLKDFLKHIANHDYSTFLKLWEEYCSGDELDTPELIEVLKAAKTSSFSQFFGKHVERIMPLWEITESSPDTHEIFKLIIDLETTNNPQMGEKVFQYLQDKYGEDEHFHDKIRLIGLRNKEQFQGAISHYELLSHIAKDKFVFHTAGWGVGIILEFSLVREELCLEFDYVAGKKDISFETAFKTLIPIPDDHFLAQRFGDPDLLEKKAKENPAAIVELLLRDLGPKTAAEIKDELCELVIPSEDWTKWWQGARAKVKKNTLIETPTNIKKPFILRKNEVPHEERLQKALATKPDANTLIQMVYSFLKDFPETLKNTTFKESLTSRLEEMLAFPEIPNPQKLQLYFFSQDLGKQSDSKLIESLLTQFSSLAAVQELIDHIDVLSFKKRALAEIRKIQPEWKKLFLDLFLSVDQGTLRDYMLSELLSEDCEKEVTEKVEELIAHPSRYPNTFIWYFQKIMGQKKLPLSNTQAKLRFFESLLILLSYVEQAPNHKDLVKKIYSILSSGRYAIVRKMMKDASVEEVKEYLLLATKCHSLNDHDIKILHSLAEVVHPSLAKLKKKTKTIDPEDVVIWSTEEGCRKVKERMQQIATVETVDNAKEIETARGHGDLRENAEFKAALERRDRLQSELKTLSDQVNNSRVITANDISTDKVGIGCVIKSKNSEGKEVTYTLLGPWDANPDKNILAFQSKLAQSMKGLTVGESFTVQGEVFTITSISSYL
jgi:transcription elongation factor GreA-like protein/transcription elongation GreA/GreB family factor